SSPDSETHRISPGNTTLTTGTPEWPPMSGGPGVGRSAQNLRPAVRRGSPQQATSAARRDQFPRDGHDVPSKDGAVVRARVDHLADELVAVPGVAPHLLVLVAGHVELVRAVAVEIPQDRGVLEAGPVGVARLALPGALRAGAPAQTPQPAAERGRHQLLLAVPVDVASGEEPREPIVDGRDHRATLRRRVRVVA